MPPYEYAFGKRENVGIEVRQIPEDEKILSNLRENMKEPPTIRAIWWEERYCSRWLAIEGCYEIRVAKELNMVPIIIELTEQSNFDGINTLDGKSPTTFNELFNELKTYIGFMIAFDSVDVRAFE